jgi:hypothetical protein
MFLTSLFLAPIGPQLSKTNVGKHNAFAQGARSIIAPERRMP